jgi:hypothetical protein
MHVNRARRQITADNVLRELEQSTSDRQNRYCQDAYLHEPRLQELL